MKSGCARFTAALFLVVALGIQGCGGGGGSGGGVAITGPTQYSNEGSVAAVSKWVSGMFDQYHEAFFVYRDFDEPGNHFVVVNKLAGSGTEDLVPAMDLSWKEAVKAGLTCIKCGLLSNVAGDNWGGYQWLNGIFPASGGSQINWGTVPEAGVNLGGSPKPTKLSFWARGAKGGEKVEFYCLGLGRDQNTGLPLPGCTNPDSSGKTSTGLVTLASGWQQIEIDLTPCDLSYVLRGFGWSASAKDNGGKSITFYLDHMRYEKSMANLPHFSVSYKPGDALAMDRMFRSAASLYDQALLCLAFLALGEDEKARLIADAIVIVQNNDRNFSDGRLIDWYTGGDLQVPPGWIANSKKDVARYPGWYNSDSALWTEIQPELAHHPGNMAWACIALLACNEKSPNPAYVAAARRIGDWIETNLRHDSPNGGYLGGIETGASATNNILRFKATEPNIDVYVAFSKLYNATNDAAWRARAAHARKFVESMWNASGSYFYTGTLDDYVTPNTQVVPEDVQAWAYLALGSDHPEYSGALDFVENNNKVEWGYDFNAKYEKEPIPDGIWYEGTAHMLLALKKKNDTARVTSLEAEFAKVIEAEDGALPAASRDAVTTGFSGWLLYRRGHIGAAAWYILAAKGVNPFRVSP